MMTESRTSYVAPHPFSKREIEAGISMATATARLDVLCVAVISRTNRPVYLRCFADTVDEVRIHHVVHSSLDIFDERRAASSSAAPGAPQSNDPYLGLLLPSVDYRVYGYATSTETKLVVVLPDGEARDAELRQLFGRLHRVVLDATSNPFHVPGGALVSPRFEAAVRQLVGVR